MSGAREPSAGQVPFIPPPPKMGKRRKRSGDGRWAIWLVALSAGVGLGIVAYRWAPGVDVYFDYWLALALG